jgi:predicted ATP-grasp superfamily ATP-dependent carboligase
MRIFVYEYICGGGLAEQPLPESLQREGWAMLRAVLEDFRDCPGVRTVTLLDERLTLGDDGWSRAEVNIVEPGRERTHFRQLARVADFTVVIAPESVNVLSERCCWAEEVGGRLLGPSAMAVHLTGDKLLLSEFWRRFDVPTPLTGVYDDAGQDLPFPLVCKPRYGAGSQGIFEVRTIEELQETSLRAWAEGAAGERIVQVPATGIAASVSTLMGPRGKLVLPAAMQQLSDDGRFRYLGGSLPLPHDLNDRAQKLALRAIAPIDGLFGYVGVDLVLGAAADGSEDFAIEINPRLTTSYVGLRALAEFNLAETMLALALGRPLPELRYRDGSVTWSADGTVQGPTVQ